MDIEKEDSTLLTLLSTMNRCKEVFDCNELTTIEDILNKAMDEIQTLRAKVASAEVLVEALRKIDSLNPNHSDDGWIKEVQLHDGESCGQIVNEFDNEVLIAKITQEALATYDKLSEVKHDTK